MPIDKSKFSPEFLQQLQDRGINLDDLEEVPTPSPEKMSAGRAALATLKGHAGGIAGGGAATIAGVALAPETGGLSLLIPVAAGLAGSYGGQKLQNAVQSDETNQAQQAELQQAEAEHPYISGATDIGASALASGGLPSIKNLVTGGRAALGKLIGREVSDEGLQALKSVAIQSAINPAIDTGVSLATGNGVPTFKSLAADVAGGALFSKSWLPGHGTVRLEPSAEPLAGKTEPRVVPPTPEPEPVVRIPAVEQTVIPPTTIPKVESTAVPKVEETVTPVTTNPTETIREGFTVAPEILQKVIDKGATKPVSVQRIFPELNLNEAEATHILDKAKAYKVEDTQNDIQSAPTGKQSQPYSPEDLNLYNETKQKMSEALQSDNMDEYGKLWKTFEDVRNKYGGMPPAKEQGAILSNENFNAKLKEKKIGTPIDLVQNIQRGKVTTGSFLQHLANTPNHPYSELAKHLLSISDSKSLQTKWMSDPTVDRSIYRYSPHDDSVRINYGDLADTRTLMEEAIHSLTSKKLTMFRDATGEQLHSKMQDYLKTGNNQAVKDLIKGYIKAAQHLGYHDMMFKNGGDPLGILSKAAAGKPDVMDSWGESAGRGNSEITYAMGNLDEFLAHAFKNEKFQNLLNEMPYDEKKSVWQHIVDAVKRILGMDIKTGSMLDHVLRTGSDIIAQERPSKSPADFVIVHGDVSDPNRKIEVQDKETGKVLWEGTDPEKAYDFIDYQTVGSKSGEAGAQPTDKDDSRKGFLRPLESTFSKVDRVSTTLGNAFRRWESKKDQYIGMKNVALEKLNSFPRADVNKVMALHREVFRNGGTIEGLSPKQQEISDTLKQYYGTIADKRREAGVTINGRQAGKNEYYVPDQLNEHTLNLFTQHATSPEAIHAENVWVDHVVKESGGKLKPEEVRQNIQDYIAALGGQNNNYNSVKFGAIRKAQGYGLPEGLREMDGIKALDRYGSRAASDLAMFEELETKPEIAASLKLKDPTTGQIAEHPNADPRLAASVQAKDAMKWVTNSFGGTMSQQAPKINALVRLVNNSLLGPATGLRDTVQMPVFALPYINKFSDLGAAMKGIANFRNESANALATGARKPSIDKVQFNQIIDSTDPVATFLNKAATMMRVFQGREAIENFNRDVTFSIGKELAKNNIVGAQAGNRKSIEFLKKFGTLVDTDPAKLRGADLEEVLNQIAKNFTDRNQGTYGGAGLPAGIIESQFAPFLSLQKWSVEKSNVIYEDVVKPFLDGSNRLPMITYTLGTLLSGAAIQQLNQLLSGRKSQDPTIRETLEVPTAKNIVGELASLMQLSSFAGIIGDSAKVLSDVGLYGKTPRSPVSFPTATAAIDLTQKTTDLIEALKNGENPWDVFKAYALDMMTHNVQAARLIANHTANQSDVERSDKFRDVRVFNQLEGGNNKDFPVTNPYLGIEENKFKKSDSPEDAIAALPALIQNAVQRANGDPYKLAAALRALKSNSYQTMPNMKSAPVQFLQYLNYLRNTQGDEEANKRLIDYITQNAMNRVKSSVIP